MYYCETDKEVFDNFNKIKEELGLKILTYNKPFEEVVTDANVANYYKSYPTLFFIDPFGYNFNINILSNLMGTFGNEIIINFMFDFINRFTSVSNLEGTYTAFFGSDKWKKANQMTGNEREQYLVNLFKDKVKEITKAKYVFAYRMCYPDKNQTYYYLVHATNHIDGNIYRLYKLNLNENEYKSINSLQSIELPIPCFLLLNKPSLKINICIKEQESFTRRLTPNEINEMIDRDYKVVDGLYKYSDSDNDISSVFISRDEIYSIILNKYIYARLVFKYKTDIGNDILQIDVAK